jgi:hypothetical protein
MTRQRNLEAPPSEIVATRGLQPARGRPDAGEAVAPMSNLGTRADRGKSACRPHGLRTGSAWAGYPHGPMHRWCRSQRSRHRDDYDCLAASTTGALVHMDTLHGSLKGHQRGNQGCRRGHVRVKRQRRGRDPVCECAKIAMAVCTERRQPVVHDKGKSTASHKEETRPRI